MVSILKCWVEEIQRGNQVIPPKKRKQKIDTTLLIAICPALFLHWTACDSHRRSLLICPFDISLRSNYESHLALEPDAVLLVAKLEQIGIFSTPPYSSVTPKMFLKGILAKFMA